jgi:hypothetical protein
VKHWADKVDWWRALGALAAVVGGVGFFQERLARFEERQASGSSDVSQLRADVRDLRNQVVDCGRNR